MKQEDYRREKIKLGRQKCNGTFFLLYFTLPPLKSFEIKLYFTVKVSKSLNIYGNAVTYSSKNAGWMFELLIGILKTIFEKR